MIELESENPPAFITARAHVVRAVGVSGALVLSLFYFFPRLC